MINQTTMNDYSKIEILTLLSDPNPNPNPIPNWSICWNPDGVRTLGRETII